MSDFFGVTTDYILKGIEPVADKEQKNKELTSKVLYISSTAFVAIGLFCAFGNWYAEQTMEAVWGSMIIQAIGIVGYFIARILSEEKSPFYVNGCSVGCIFCESGRNGFVRNLTPSEIVQQVVLIRQKVNRIVFMGMGEPLFNYDNLIAAIHILRDRNGLNFPTDGITVSTVGPVNQLKKLREEHLKIQLTISLHAATQAARNCIIPHMHMYAIEDVVKQALSYSQRHNRKVVFAYLLLPGINDRSSDIRQLAKWFKGKNVMINVLQYNPTSNSKIRAPQKQEMVAFKHQLEQTGLEVTMRVSHGREIKAACGQLANTYNKAKKQQK